MKGTLISKKQKNKKLIIVLGIILTITLGNFIRNYFSDSESGFSFNTFSPFSAVVYQKKDISINFTAFNNPILKDLKLFEEIEVKEASVGRINPYIPYYEME